MKATEQLKEEFEKSSSKKSVEVRTKSFISFYIILKRFI